MLCFFLFSKAKANMKQKLYDKTLVEKLNLTSYIGMVVLINSLKNCGNINHVKCIMVIRAENRMREKCLFVLIYHEFN